MPALARSLAFTTKSGGGGGGVSGGVHEAREERRRNEGDYVGDVVGDVSKRHVVGDVSHDPAASSAAQPERDGVRKDGTALAQGSGEMDGGGGGLPNSSHAAAATLRRILETEVTLFISHDSAAIKRASNMSSPLHFDLYRLSRFLSLNSQMSSGIQLWACVWACVWVCMCGCLFR